MAQLRESFERERNLKAEVQVDGRMEIHRFAIVGVDVERGDAVLMRITDDGFPCDSWVLYFKNGELKDVAPLATHLARHAKFPRTC